MGNSGNEEQKENRVKILPQIFAACYRILFIYFFKLQAVALQMIFLVIVSFLLGHRPVYLLAQKLYILKFFCNSQIY